MTLTLQDIDLGASANDGTGDTPRAAGTKINANNAAITAFLKALAALDTVGTAQIDSGAVTLAKMADMADGRILGNNAGIAGPPIALTASQIKTMLAISVASDISGLGTGVATALAANADSASGFVTQTGGDARFARLGVGNALTGAQSIAGGTLNGTVLDISQTWGGTGAYTGILYNVTDSGPANAASNLIDLRVGGISKIRTQKDGSLIAAGVATFTGGFATGANILLTANAGQIYFGASNDLIISRAAAATLQHGAADAASPVAQTVQSQGSRSGTDNNVAGGNFTLQSGNGTGNAAPSALILRSPVPVASGTGAQTQTEGLRINYGTAVLKSYTVSALPSASGAGAGALAYVTDANATTARSTVAGGGSNKVIVMSDATNWLIVA